MTADSLPGVVDAIDQLEDMINTGRRIPLTPSIVVNEEVALELLDHARLQLPDDLVEARSILNERGRLMEEAEAAAEQIISRAQAEAAHLLTLARSEAEGVERDAQERARDLVAKHSVLRDATERAEALVAEGEGQSARVRAEADSYARQVLERLASDLERATSSVRHGLDALTAGDVHPRGGRRPG